MTYQAIDVAHYLILIQGKNKFLDSETQANNKSLCHLKLQKLLYYAQGLSLSLYDTPCFNENIEAWEHGPVVPSIYSEYKDYNNNPLPTPSASTTFFDDQYVRLLHTVGAQYGMLHPWTLVEMTHQEDPWKKSYGGKYSNNVIDQGLLKDSFKDRYNKKLSMSPVDRFYNIRHKHIRLFEALANA